MPIKYDTETLLHKWMDTGNNPLNPSCMPLIIYEKDRNELKRTTKLIAV